MDLVMITRLFPSKFDEDQNFGLSSWKYFVPLWQLPKKNFSADMMTLPCYRGGGKQLLDCQCGHDDFTLLADA